MIDVDEENLLMLYVIINNLNKKLRAENLKFKQESVRNKNEGKELKKKKFLRLEENNSNW